MTLWVRKRTYPYLNYTVYMKKMYGSRVREKPRTIMLKKDA